MIPDVLELGNCAVLCDSNDECSFYSHLSPPHPLSHLCILYSSCLSMFEECEGCISGVTPCITCSYEDTVEENCGECQRHSLENQMQIADVWHSVANPCFAVPSCSSGWSEFDGYCYSLLRGYNDRDDCDRDCEQVRYNKM